MTNWCILRDRKFNTSLKNMSKFMVLLFIIIVLLDVSEGIVGSSIDNIEENVESQLQVPK